jgi:prepilin-type processing-associated H-X9-DG protein/prepilin-type N-terminal cleavage/methylation domain-containing protein
MKRRRGGFTLTELTVVLAVVLILASILVSAFARYVQPKRERTQCQTNLRHIALAIRQYMKDSGEEFPSVHGNKHAFGWGDAIQPYFKDTRVFQCPSESTWPAPGDGPKSKNYTDYFYNSNLSGQNYAALQYIANTIMLGDSITGDATRHSNGDSDRNTAAIQPLVDVANKAVGAATRHLDGANYAFADGHVKWLKGEDSNTCPAIRCGGCSANPTFAIN